jgi:hypothetical protein
MPVGLKKLNLGSTFGRRLPLRQVLLLGKDGKQTIPSYLSVALLFDRESYQDGQAREQAGCAGGG